MMAIMSDSPVIEFAPYHFNATSFDKQVEDHGSLALLRIATPCPCWDSKTGRADPACKVCFPFEYLWDPPKSVKVIGPNRAQVRHLQPTGTYNDNEATFDFKTDCIPPHKSRFSIPSSVITVSDVLTKGKEDIIRYSSCLDVESVRYATRVPPTGHPYVVTPISLAFSGVSPDLTFDGRHVTWHNNAIPDGTRYTVRFRAFAEWVVWTPQDRSENDAMMPYRFKCKQLDFLLHPRGEEKLSY